MFFYCTDIISIDLSNFDTSSSFDMRYMFYGCSSLISLDLSNFNTSSIEYMEYMLYGCSSLISLDLSNSYLKYFYFLDSCKSSLISINLSNSYSSIKASMENLFSNYASLISVNFSNFYSLNYTNMKNMFYNCKSLISVDFSNFNTSFIISIENMFYGCSSLSSFNFINYKISIRDMSFMFYECSSLISINLSSFDLSLVTNMESMFYKCNSLKFVDTSYLNTSSISKIDKMFYSCKSLKNINLSKFNTSLVKNMKKIFSGCSSLTSIDLSNINTSLVESMNKLFQGCSSLKYLNLSGFNVSLVNNFAAMFQNCKSLKYLDISNFNMSNNIFYMEKMFSGTSNLEFLNISNFNSNETILSNILDDIPDNLVYCNKKETNISEFIYNFTVNNEICLINYCDKNYKNIQKKILENGVCIDDCQNSKNSKYEYKGRCYFNCPQKTSPTFYNKYLCEDNCPVQNQYKLNEANELECIEDFPIIDFFNQKLIINPNMNIKDILNIISNIKMEIKNGALDPLINNIYEKEEDSIIENINIIFQLTSSNNQKIKEYKNLSSINLGECENILKEKYNITKNISLLIFKIDYKIEELNIPIIKFEVFNPINKEQLNLDFCKEKKINFDIDIPVSIKEDNLFKYDPNGDYYNNICFTYSSDKGADIILKDRKKEYNKNNMSLCEKNCNFKGYNQKTKKAICECNLNDKALLSLEDVINKEKLLNNFIDIKSTTNILVMKCYLLLFSKKSIFINIGIYIFLIIIIIHIISMVIFYIKGYPLIYHGITNIFENKKNKISKNEECDKKDLINITIEGNNMNKNDLEKSKTNSNDNDIINKIDNNTNNQNNQNNNSIQTYDDRIKNIDYEMNDFSYKEAVDNDKRSFFEYFIFLIKTKHWLVLWFYSNTQYNPIMIKICLFTFSFALYYAINTLFFDDETMNKIYENEGVFNFVYLLPKIIYSTIISSLIMIIIKKLAVIETEIIEFKKNNDIKECENKLPKLIKCIKIKFICFFALSSIFLILFSYYVSCFCAVYKKTQIILIKDTLISFGLHLLYPFIFYAIASIIRIFSVQKPEKFLEFFYETSKLL